VKRFDMKKLPLLGLNGIELVKGPHPTRELGTCAMEAVAWLAGEKHSDAPECACPVISKYVAVLNDSLTAEERQLLKPYLPRIIGTRDGNVQKRMRLLVHLAGSVFAPIALEAEGFKDHAFKMRTLKPGAYKKQEKLANAAHDATSTFTYATSHAAYAAAYAATAATSSIAAAYATAATSHAAYAADAAISVPNHSARKIVVDEALRALDDVIKIGEKKRLKTRGEL
jgi:hypothetical protein